MTSSPRPARLRLTGGRGRLAALIADYFRAPRHHVELYSRTQGDGFGDLARLCQETDWTCRDTLLHLAWSTLPATSEQHPGREAEVDLPLLDSLLQSLTRLPSARRPHLVFFSSGGTIYGNAPGRPNREDDPCHPIGNYGRAKLAAEARINAAIVQHGLACTILRISNPYGYPVPFARAQGVIPHAISAAAEGKTLRLWGDGHARKDFLYHTDFLAALDLVITQRPIGSFNLCAGESHSIREVIQLVERHTGRHVVLEHAPAPSWDVTDSCLDPAKLCRVIAWRPQVSLEEGIRRSVAGAIEH
ncbi:MAG: GDP-mannose 4,6-dehydratase [Opitutaceae bacterium]|nr:GDP-mannose 4,6-dehydratase [Opitutaceae bacterium]